VKRYPFGVIRKYMSVHWNTHHFVCVSQTVSAQTAMRPELACWRLLAEHLMAKVGNLRGAKPTVNVPHLIRSIGRICRTPCPS
jgi:hypothetical protein